MQAYFAHFQVPAYAYRAAPVMVTEEELRLVEAFLAGQVFTDAEAAEALSLSPADTEALLRNAYRRSVIDRSGDGWVITDFYTRFFAFCRECPDVWRGMDRSVRATLSEWALEEYIVKRWLHTAEPNRRDVVLTPDEALDLLTRQTVIGVAGCLCRPVFDTCDHSRETCLSFGDGPNTDLDRGVARPIAPDEAAALIRALHDEGLILTKRGEEGLCACCGDCCLDYRAADRMGMLGEWPEAPHIAVSGPGEASHADRCPLRALTAADGRLTVDPDRCVGCGLCPLPLTDRT